MMNAFRPRLLATAALAAISMAALAPAARADEQTVRLIQLLIEKGILTKGQASELLAESGGKASRKKAAAPAAAASAATADEGAAAPGEVRVTYVPAFIRRQIADQVRADVMSQAHEEGWAAPDTLAEWTRRVRIYGDLRLRYEADLFDKSNYAGFINFPAINNSGPLDITGLGLGKVATPASYNTTEDRNRFRVRARLGAKFDVSDSLVADMRIATGDAGATSTNATFGGSGAFSKYAVSLDRAYLSYTGVKGLTLSAGRMNNPFFTTDLFFHNDIGFDGVAATYTHALGDQLSAFGTAGAFPVLNTALDFSTNSLTKFASNDAYLFALAGGLSYHPPRPYSAKLGIGFYDFNGVQGGVSAPCTIQPAGGVYYCSTDNLRAPVGQFGNTYYAIRNIVPAPGVTDPPNPQYFGLASRFRVLEVHPQVSLLRWHPIDVVVDGEFLKNFGFNRAQILNHGPEYLGPKGPQNAGADTNYTGGDTGYMFRVTVGHPSLAKRWDWNAYVSYKYLESDATLDALNDSDFHMGGTNAKGFILGGAVGVAANTSLGLKLMSAQAVSGPQYNVDVIQLDLNSSF